MPRDFFGPFPRERRFIYSLDIALIQRLLWPLFAVFVILAFADVLTTLLAFSIGIGFVERNPYASEFFRLGFAGFLLAYIAKYVPAVPLLYMIKLEDKTGKHDFEVRLLKFTALVVLVGTDVYLGYIVLANNLPNLLAASETLR